LASGTIIGNIRQVVVACNQLVAGNSMLIDAFSGCLFTPIFFASYRM